MKRVASDEYVRRIREWVPMKQLAREAGITSKYAHLIHKGQERNTRGKHERRT